MSRKSCMPYIFVYATSLSMYIYIYISAILCSTSTCVYVKECCYKVRHIESICADSYLSMHMNIYVHVHIYICMYTCVYIYTSFVSTEASVCYNICELKHVSAVLYILHLVGKYHACFEKKESKKKHIYIYI